MLVLYYHVYKALKVFLGFNFGGVGEGGVDLGWIDMPVLIEFLREKSLDGGGNIYFVFSFE